MRTIGARVVGDLVYFDLADGSTRVGYLRDVAGFDLPPGITRAEVIEDGACRVYTAEGDQLAGSTELAAQLLALGTAEAADKAKAVTTSAADAPVAPPRDPQPVKVAAEAIQLRALITRAALSKGELDAAEAELLVEKGS